MVAERTRRAYTMDRDRGCPMLDVSWLRHGPWLQRLAGGVARWRPRGSLIGLGIVALAAAVAALLVAFPLQPVDQGARVEVAGVVFGFAPNAERLLATIAIKNAGSLPALIISSNNAVILTPRQMTGAEEDGEWDHLGNAEETRHDAPRRLEPGQEWPDYAVVRTLERKEYQAFLAGTYLIYFLMRTEYRDALLPVTKHRITEVCHYYVKDLARPRSCHGHNRSFVGD